MKLLHRYGLWVLAAVVAATIGTWIIGTARPASYTSVAVVDVEPAVHPYASAAPLSIATEQQVVTSGVVLGRVAPKLGISQVALARQIGVSNKAGTNLLSIGCTMPSAAVARYCAAAVSRAYQAFRNEVTFLPNVQMADPLKVTLVTPANTPVGPSGTRLSVLLGIGAVFGLLLGIGSAYVRDRADDRVRDLADFEQCADIAVLAGIPRLSRMVRPERVVSTAPLSRAAEAYQYLRLRLDRLTTPAAGSPASAAEASLSSPDDGWKVLLVASAGGREGRTCVASNLAETFARAGSSVLLVDADLRHPALDNVYQVGAHAGLSDLLAGRAMLDEITVPTRVPGLTLITAGTLLDGSSVLLDRTRLIAAFAQLRSMADVVVVDSAPVLESPDTIAVAFMCDLVAVVADVRRTTRAAIRASVSDLAAAAPPVMMGLLNNMAPASWGRLPRGGRAGEPATTATLLASGVHARPGRANAKVPARIEPPVR
jgi:polysaccharide biosynthesis transport protein